VSTKTPTAAFKPGARVRWAGDEYVIWAMHPKTSWRWISRDGRPPVQARVANLELLEAAATPRPAQADRRARLKVVANNPHPLAARDRELIRAAIEADALAHDGIVSPNRVRAALSNEHGLTVRPRMLSAAYSALQAENKLRSLGWQGVNDDTRSGNAGRPMRLWQWIGGEAAAS
jgi:hypothetical protein